MTFGLEADMVVLCLPCVAACVLPACASPLQEAATELGISPSALATCGVDSAQASSLLASLASAELLPRLIQGRESVRQTERALEAAQRENDPFSTEGQQAIQAAEQAVRTAKELLRADREALLASVTECLSATQRARLARWLAAEPLLPGEFKVMAWSDTERVRLRRELAAERAAIAKGRAVPAETAAFLANVRIRAEVVEARQNVAQHLAGVELAFRARGL